MQGIVTTSPIQDDDYGIVLRQPVLWHGGIRSCRICVLDEQTNSAHKWNTASSMKLPISMCSSFAADFGRDEMTLFSLKSLGAIQECKVASWDNGATGPYMEEDYSLIVPSIAPMIISKSNTVASSTTMCWSNRVKGHRATKVHLKWMTSIAVMIANGKKHFWWSSGPSKTMQTCILSLVHL